MIENRGELVVQDRVVSCHVSFAGIRHKSGQYRDFDRSESLPVRSGERFFDPLGARSPCPALGAELRYHESYGCPVVIATMAHARDVPSRSATRFTLDEQTLDSRCGRSHCRRSFVSNDGVSGSKSSGRDGAESV